MKSTGIIRTVDDLGRIVIPKPLRKKMSINEFDTVEIYVEGDKIILTKYSNACLFCGNENDLTKFREKYICASCKEQIKKDESIDE